MIEPGDYVQLQGFQARNDLSWLDFAIISKAVGVVNAVMDEDGYWFSVRFYHDGINSDFLLTEDNLSLVGGDNIPSEDNLDSRQDRVLMNLLQDTATEHYNGHVIDGNRDRVRAGLDPIGESKWHKERGQDPHIYVRRYMKV